MLAMLVLLLTVVLVRLPAMTWEVLRMSATAATDVVVVVPSVYSLIQSSLAACSSLFVCSTAGLLLLLLHSSRCRWL